MIIVEGVQSMTEPGENLDCLNKLWMNFLFPRFLLTAYTRNHPQI